VRSHGVPQGEILLISGISGMMVVFALSVVRGNLRRLQPQKWGGLALIGICQCLAWIFWVDALPDLPLTSMYVVAFMTPMTVAGLAALLLKEHLGWKRATAIGTGFAGVVIAVNPVGLFHNSGALLPNLLVFGSMVGTAGQMLLLRAVGRTESSEAISFYPRLVLVLAGIIYGATSGFSEITPLAFLAICASGALGATGWALMSKAYKNAPAAAVAPFHYSQMITGALVGYLIWGDVPNAYLLSGAVVIIASGVYLVRHERRASRLMVRVD